MTPEWSEDSIKNEWRIIEEASDVPHYEPNWEDVFACACEAREYGLPWDNFIYTITWL